MTCGVVALGRDTFTPGDEIWCLFLSLPSEDTTGFCQIGYKQGDFVICLDL
jgi:hypothetical protein